MSSFCHKINNNNSLKTDKDITTIPTVCIFVFTALIHSTLCRDCSHIFVRFQTVVVFCDRVSSTSSLFSFCFFFLSHEHPYIFNNDCNPYIVCIFLSAVLCSAHYVGNESHILSIIRLLLVSVINDCITKVTSTTNKLQTRIIGGWTHRILPLKVTNFNRHNCNSKNTYLL